MQERHLQRHQRRLPNHGLPWRWRFEALPIRCSSLGKLCAKVIRPQGSTCTNLPRRTPQGTSRLDRWPIKLRMCQLLWTPILSKLFPKRPSSCNQAQASGCTQLRTSRSKQDHSGRSQGRSSERDEWIGRWSQGISSNHFLREWTSGTLADLWWPRNQLSLLRHRRT